MADMPRDDCDNCFFWCRSLGGCQRLYGCRYDVVDDLPYLDEEFFEKTDDEIDAELEAAEAFWLYGDLPFGFFVEKELDF